MNDIQESKNILCDLLSLLIEQFTCFLLESSSRNSQLQLRIRHLYSVRLFKSVLVEV